MSVCVTRRLWVCGTARPIEHCYTSVESIMIVCVIHVGACVFSCCRQSKQHNATSIWFEFHGGRRIDVFVRFIRRVKVSYKLWIRSFAHTVRAYFFLSCCWKYSCLLWKPNGGPNCGTRYPHELEINWEYTNLLSVSLSTGHIVIIIRPTLCAHVIMELYVTWLVSVARELVTDRTFQFSTCEWCSFYVIMDQCVVTRLSLRLRALDVAYTDYK